MFFFVFVEVFVEFDRFRSSMESLRALVQEWFQANPRRLERLALFKDLKSLIALVPGIVGSGPLDVHDSAETLLRLAADMLTFLKSAVAL